MKYDYNIIDLKKCINNLDIRKNDTLYITGNLFNLGRIELKTIKELPKIIYKHILKKIGPGGTVVVPTHSFNLVKNKKIFDLKKTTSESGIFSKYILNQKKSIRQIHPYSSSTAIGKYANYICTNNTRNVYGKNSPFEKMIKLNAKFISLGMEINENCSQVHHAVYIMKVPYRYNKKFSHKIKIKNKIYKKTFNMFVLHKEFINIKRNKNKKIVKNFKKKYKVKKIKLGIDFIYIYDLTKFFRSNIELLKKDKFCWIGKKLKKTNLN